MSEVSKMFTRYSVFAAHRSSFSLLRPGSWVSKIIQWFRPPYNHIEMWFYGRSFGNYNYDAVNILGIVISADMDGVVARPIPLSHLDLA